MKSTDKIYLKQVMMNKLSILSCLLFSTVISCNAQQIQNRTVNPFNSMSIAGSVNVFYTNSDTMSVMVKAEEGEINNVETKVTNSTLFISNNGKFTKPVNVYVKNSNLKTILSSGAAQLKTSNVIKGDTLLINASGASKLDLNVNAYLINSVQSGANSLKLSGTSNDLRASISGATNLKAYDLICKNVSLVTSGSSSAKVYATDKLLANASGASSIKIKGDAKDISAEATPAASITKINDASTSGDKSDGDSTVYKWKGKKVIIIGKDKDSEVYDDSSKPKSQGPDEFKHWTGFSMGVNGYMNKGAGINLPTKNNYMDLNYARSYNFQFNLIERQFNIVKNHFKIVTGFGFDYHLYEFSHKTNLNPDSSFTFGKIDSSGLYSYQKNKLRNTYIQVPLLFEFNTSNNPDKTFHIAFGVIGQYLISSRTKQVLEQNKFEITRVRKDSYNLSPFAAKAHVNIGYRGWTIFAEYSLTRLFQSGKGPELYPFSVGLRLIPFA